MASPVIRDRIVDFRRVPASELVPHPLNWRTHPDAQRRALRAVLEEIGYAGAALARLLPDGRLQLIDGHLRAEETPNMSVPVLVTDLDEKEAELMLLTHDPLAALAGTNEANAAELLAGVETENADLKEFLEALQVDEGIEIADEPAEELPRISGAEEIGLLVECPDEEKRTQLRDTLEARGYKCRETIL